MRSPLLQQTAGGGCDSSSGDSCSWGSAAFGESLRRLKDLRYCVANKGPIPEARLAKGARWRHGRVARQVSLPPGPRRRDVPRESPLCLDAGPGLPCPRCWRPAALDSAASKRRAASQAFLAPLPLSPSPPASAQFASAPDQALRCVRRRWGLVCGSRFGLVLARTRAPPVRQAAGLPPQRTRGLWRRRRLSRDPLAPVPA